MNQVQIWIKLQLFNCSLHWLHKYRGGARQRTRTDRCRWKKYLSLNQEAWNRQFMTGGECLGRKFVAVSCHCPARASMELVNKLVETIADPQRQWIESKFLTISSTLGENFIARVAPSIHIVDCKILSDFSSLRRCNFSSQKLHAELL